MQQQQQLQPGPISPQQKSGDAYMLSGGQQTQPMIPMGQNNQPMSGAPKPNFTLNRPKPPSKGFKQEIKNLLKSDKKSTITIEKKDS